MTLRTEVDKFIEESDFPSMNSAVQVLKMIIERVDDIEDKIKKLEKDGR